MGEGNLLERRSQRSLPSTLCCFFCSTERMTRVFACGDNSFGNVLPNEPDLHLLSPVELPDVSSLAAASWSQTVVREYSCSSRDLSANL